MKLTLPSQHRSQGKRALAQGQVDRALVEFSDASREEPTDARNFLHLAQAHIRKGNGAAAIDAYRQAARIHTAQGFFRHAVAIYKNILTLSPGDIDSHRNLAQLFAGLGLLSDATAQYEYVLQSSHLADRSAEAFEALRCIVEMNPTDARIHLRFVDMAFALGKRPEGMQRLRSAAALLKSSGRIDEFLRIGERLLQEEPENKALARDLAKGYIVRGNGRFALARLKMCYDDAPGDVETLDLLTQTFELLGEREKAISLLKALAEIHREQGRYPQSQDALHRALDLEPANHDLQSLLTETTRKRRVSEVEIAIDLDAPVSVFDSGIPRAVVPESETLQSHMPEFITSQELKAYDPSPVFDLFPVNDARKLVAECQQLVEKTADRLRKLVALLPSQLSSRDLIDHASDALIPGSELVTELSILAESLARNDWVNELAQQSNRTRAY
ncbi:MAG: tetratricopeptide repeat protein [Deltaproteobacteria bacterium]|nr:tetratricopeptide repeat protein [Deltaproteobacteria bacterium]